MPSAVLVLEMKDGRIYSIAVPADFSAEEATTRRGLLVTPEGSFLGSEIASVHVERKPTAEVLAVTKPGTLSSDNEMPGRRVNAPRPDTGGEVPCR